MHPSSLHQKAARALSLALLFLPPNLHAQSAPPPPEPLSNTFTTATETVLTNYDALNLHAPASTYDPAFQTLKASASNLEAMASTDAEHTVLNALHDLLFDLSACRIQALDDTDTTSCEAKLATAKTHVRETLHPNPQTTP